MSTSQGLGPVVDLNSASEEEIANLPMVGLERAKRLCESRPFGSWDDIKRIPGFGNGMIAHLKSGGAKLGQLD